MRNHTINGVIHRMVVDEKHAAEGLVDARPPVGEIDAQGNLTAPIQGEIIQVQAAIVVVPNNHPLGPGLKERTRRLRSLRPR
jgi:hypothetical protein